MNGQDHMNAGYYYACKKPLALMLPGRTLREAKELARHQWGKYAALEEVFNDRRYRSPGFRQGYWRK